MDFKKTLTVLGAAMAMPLAPVSAQAQSEISDPWPIEGCEIFVRGECWEPHDPLECEVRGDCKAPVHPRPEPDVCELYRDCIPDECLHDSDCRPWHDPEPHIKDINHF